MYSSNHGGTNNEARDREAARERRALSTIFWCTMGPAWVNKVGWQEGESSDVRNWWGIGVDLSGDEEDEGRVTLVDLRRNGLSGAIPPEIGDLKQLRHLYLGDNALQGLIPSSISQLRHLEILSLRGNSLKGHVVPELGALTALQTLSLRDNHLSNAIPPEIGQLTALKHLFLSNNKLTGPIPEEMSKLEELEQLFLADNDLEGPIPASFGGLVLLQELVLSGNGFTGPIPMELSYLTDLVRLELDDNNFTGDIPSSLALLVNLKVLYLNNNSLTGPIPPCIGKLCFLERLDLSNNKLAGILPPELGQLLCLQFLILKNNRLTVKSTLVMLREGTKLFSSSIMREEDFRADRSLGEALCRLAVCAGGIPCELGRLNNITLLLLDGNQLSESVPIVGGKGLREWQVLKRKAYLNSWSMMDRLAHLERENALIKKELVMLRKSKPSSGRQHPAMRVDLSSATTAISTPMSTATATPYSPGTLVSNEESTTERSQEQTSRGLPEASPSKNPNVRPLSLAVGTGDSGVMVGKRSVEFGNSVSFSESNEHNHLHAPGEQQRANILARWASMGHEQTPRGHANGDSLKDNPCLDRITARRVLLSSAQRGALSSADTSIGSPTATRERSGVPSDSSSSDSGPIRRMRTVTDASPAGLDKPEQATGVPETNGVGAADVLLRRAGASSDSRARMRTASPNPLSPLHSPMHGQLRVHSAHGNGSTVVGTAGRGGRGIVAQRKLMIEARRSKAASAGDSSKTGRSWAPLVGSQASFDNLRQEAANCTRANVGINGNDEGGVGSGRSTSGESYHGGQQGEGRRIEPRKGAIAQFMGLFGVTAVGEVGNGRDGFDDDDDEDDGGDGEDDDELSEKVRCDAPAGASRVPQQMAMTLDDHGNVRKKIYTCSPE